MEIMIYTDASVKDAQAAYAFMILSETEHIATRAGVYSPDKKAIGICSAEFRCIENAVKFCEQLGIPKETKITVYSDSTTAINWAKKSIKSQYEITYVHIRGHQANLNPNKIIDSLAKGVLACNDSI